MMKHGGINQQSWGYMSKNTTKYWPSDVMSEANKWQINLQTCSVKAHAVISYDIIWYQYRYYTLNYLRDINGLFDKQMVIMVGKWFVPLISD
jgi:hypothetical protein